jgi:hypothetical protein
MLRNIDQPASETDFAILVRLSRPALHTLAAFLFKENEMPENEMPEEEIKPEPIATRAAVEKEMSRIRAIFADNPENGDREDLISYAKHVIDLRRRSPSDTGAREALEMARQFIEIEYRSQSAEEQGEWLGNNTRQVYAAICAALSPPVARCSPLVVKVMAAGPHTLTKDEVERIDAARAVSPPVDPIAEALNDGGENDRPHAEFRLEIVAEELFAFLLGEGPLDGLWFEETRKSRKPFWWRTPLRDLRRAYRERKGGETARRDGE